MDDLVRRALAEADQAERDFANYQYERERQQRERERIDMLAAEQRRVREWLRTSGEDDASPIAEPPRQMSAQEQAPWDAWLEANLERERDVIREAFGMARVDLHKRQDDAVARLEERISRLEDSIATLTARLDAFEEGNIKRLRVVSQ